MSVQLSGLHQTIYLRGGIQMMCREYHSQYCHHFRAQSTAATAALSTIPTTASVANGPAMKRRKISAAEEKGMDAILDTFGPLLIGLMLTTMELLMPRVSCKVPKESQCTVQCQVALNLECLMAYSMLPNLLPQMQQQLPAVERRSQVLGRRESGSS